MATVLKSAKDASKYIGKLLAKHPDGILIIGPAGSGKSTLLKGIMDTSDLHVYEGDNWGKQVKVEGEDQWHIDWTAIPDDFDVVEGVPDNIELFEDTWDTEKRAVILLDSSPERWIQTMKLRGENEQHDWTDMFKDMGTWSASKAKKYLGEEIVKFRNRVPYFGDRIYTARTDNWKGYETKDGRTKLNTKNSKAKDEDDDDLVEIFEHPLRDEKNLQNAVEEFRKAVKRNKIVLSLVDGIKVESLTPEIICAVHENSDEHHHKFYGLHDAKFWPLSHERTHAHYHLENKAIALVSEDADTFENYAKGEVLKP